MYKKHIKGITVLTERKQSLQTETEEESIK